MSPRSCWRTWLRRWLRARRLRSDGLPVSPSVLVVAEWAADCVRPRLGETTFDRLVDVLDRGRMDPLLLSKADAAQLLGGVSVRTVDRLVESGELTLVEIRGASLIRRADLDAYVTSLTGPRSFRE